MARGWESKSIEAQQEEAAADRRRSKQAPPSAADQTLAAKRRHFELALQRTREQLASAEHPRRRAQLQSAERFLQLELDKLPLTQKQAS
jgi:hypothetical protein